MSAMENLSTTDRALVASLAVWGGVEALPLLRRFGAQKARVLAGALVPEPPPDPLAYLRTAGKAQLGPDLRRVHPSWFVRALREESPAVRRVIVSDSPEPLRTLLLRGLDLSPDDLVPDRLADPDSRGVAHALWTERLVGDLPHRADDPPAIEALATLGPVGLYRLARLCGIAKRAIIPGSTILAVGRLMDERFTFFRDRPEGPFDPRLVQLAANEWASTESLGRHRLARFGLATPGRLLNQADAYRVRWALQHVPYPIAKRLRVAASRPEASVRAVVALEGQVLEAALARLRAEVRAGDQPATGRSPTA